MRAGEGDGGTHGGQDLQAAAVRDATGRQHQLLRRRVGRRRQRLYLRGTSGLLSIDADDGGQGGRGGGWEAE